MYSRFLKGREVTLPSVLPVLQENRGVTLPRVLFLLHLVTCGDGVVTVVQEQVV